jgi:hypothetical protein
MLTKLEIQNIRSDTLALPLQDVSGGYVVKEIGGLDPVNATLTSSSTAQVDGAQLQSSNRETRNITLKLGLEPDFSPNNDDVRSLRSGLYEYLMPKANVVLKFYNDDILFAVTAGTVESFENSMFSADPEVNVSIICWDPDFIAPEDAPSSGSTVSTTTTTTIAYTGTTEAGFIFTLNVNRTCAGFTLYVTHPDNTQQKYDVVTSLLSGDVVTVTTIPGSKSIILTRAGASSSLLGAVTTVSVWPNLTKGDNLFRAFASGAAIPFTMSYTPKYGAL